MADKVLNEAERLREANEASLSQLGSLIYEQIQNREFPWIMMQSRSADNILFDQDLHLALQLQREPHVVVQSESVFFRSRFSAVISAITFFIRWFSMASLATWRSSPLACLRPKIASAEPSSCLRQW